MKIVFVSNFFNHHQQPLAKAFYKLLGDEYTFIETAIMGEERVKLGWGGMQKPCYVKQMYIKEQTAICQELINSADVVIHGSAPLWIIRQRLKDGKITFRYTERRYKKKCPIYMLPKYFFSDFKNYIRYKKFYMLCASAYTSADFSKTHTFRNKAYKWGYFTEVNIVDN